MKRIAPPLHAPRCHSRQRSPWPEAQQLQQTRHQALPHLLVGCSHHRRAARVEEAVLPSFWSASFLFLPPCTACAPCALTRRSAASPTAPPSPPIHAASGPSSTSHERSEVGCRWGLDAACGTCTLRVLLLSKVSKKKRTKRVSRTGLRLATATPALAALRLAHEHTRAEHARHARTMRARLASHAHALTRQHALTSKSLATVLESLATGRPSAGPPLAHLARTCAANTLAISAACDPHASPTCCACHPPPPLHIATRTAERL